MGSLNYDPFSFGFDAKLTANVLTASYVLLAKGRHCKERMSAALEPGLSLVKKMICNRQCYCVVLPRVKNSFCWNILVFKPLKIFVMF